MFVITFFCLKNLSVHLFRAALYELILVLRKDVLFHYSNLINTSDTL
jgi:hypothetical protein